MRSFRLVVIAFLAGLLVLTPASAQIQPTSKDKIVVETVVDILQRANITHPEFDDAFSKRVFQNFLSALDSSKYTLLKSDIDEFRPSETKLDDELKTGDATFAFKVLHRFQTRRAEAQKVVEEMLSKPMDFSVQESLVLDAKTLDYPKDEKERNDRLRQTLKFELLRRKYEPKPPTEEEARKKLLIRWRDITRNVARFDSGDLLEIYLSSAAHTLDPHSDYMNAKNFEDFISQGMQLNVEGIGARLRTEDDTPVIEEVVPGGPAFKDGRLKHGDKIVAVSNGDGKFHDIVGMKLQDAVRLIRGPQGTKVELKVVPAGKNEPVVYALIREKVLLKDAQAKSEIIEAGEKADGTKYRLGVITAPSFYGTSRRGDGPVVSLTADVRKFLREFTEKKVDAVVLDVRGNPGGLLDEAVELAGLFLDEGTVVQVKGLDGSVRRHNDPETGQAWDGPVAVLIDRLSASASEILAGCLKDYGRGLIIGDATFGKGTVQQLLPIGNDNVRLGAMKLTVQFFFRANGVSTQSAGVKPDVSLPSVWQATKIGERFLDNVLKVDPVPEVERKNYGYVGDTLKKELQAKSGERVKASADLQKLQKRIDKVRNRIENVKSVPLKEDEYKEFRKTADVEDDPAPAEDRKPDRGFDTKDAGNREVLAVVTDYLNGLKKAR